MLLVDGDMQLNLSLSFFSEDEVLKMAAGEKNLYYAIGKQQDLTDFIRAHSLSEPGSDSLIHADEFHRV